MAPGWIKIRLTVERTMATPIDPYAKERRRPTTALLVGVVLLALILLIGGGLATLGLLGPRGQNALATKQETPSVLPQVTKPAPVLPQVNEPAPALEVPTDTGMPDDVRDWLEHLRKTEERRKKMAADQLGELAVMMAKMQTAGLADAMKEILSEDDSQSSEEPSKADLVKIDAAEKKREWQALLTDFQSYPPPAECAPIQASYSQALGETSGMIIEVLEAVDMAQESPEKAISALTQMQGTSSGRIDELAKATDGQVQDICDKYKTRKWFSIASDVGGGILGKLGF